MKRTTLKTVRAGSSAICAGTLVSISLRDAHMQYYTAASVLCPDWQYAAVVLQ